MRPERFLPDDSDENPTLMQDADLLSAEEGERFEGRQRSSLHPRRAPPTGRPIGERGSSFPGGILAGKYRVEQVSERTSQEIIVIARHVELGEPVILRHLTPEAASSPEVVATFIDGARRALQLRGVHVERVTDLGRLDSGAPYRVAELPRGPSFEEFVRVRGGLPPEDAVDLVLLACEGVAEAHAIGLVHRNLSTTNIVLERHPDGAPLVKVRGFGVPDPLADDADLSAGLARNFAGRNSNALRYASPEQIREPHTVDGRADIWALGAILYELLAGVPVYSARTSSALLAMIVADPPIALESYCSEVDPELETIVLSCLSKNPDGRPSTVEELVRALLPFGSEQVDGVATRIGRVLKRGGMSQAPFSTGAPRMRTSIPALPSRGTGPFYGNSSLLPPPLPYAGAYRTARPSPRGSREAPRTRAPERLRTVEAFPSETSRSVGLLIAGAALGGVAAFLVNSSGWTLSSPASAPAPLAVASAPVQTPAPNPPASLPSATAVAVQPAKAPVLRREPLPEAEPRRTNQAPKGASRDDDEERRIIEPALSNRAAPGPSFDDEESLFDKPE